MTLTQSLWCMNDKLFSPCEIWMSIFNLSLTRNKLFHFNQNILKLTFYMVISLSLRHIFNSNDGADAYKVHIQTRHRWINLKYATTYHEKTAEIHATQNRIFHLRNAQKNAQKFPLFLQSCQQCRGRALQIKNTEYI